MIVLCIILIYYYYYYYYYGTAITPAIVFSFKVKEEK